MVERDHRVVPQAGAEDDRLAHQRGHDGPPAAEDVGEREEHYRHRPPRGLGEQVLQRVDQPVGEVVLQGQREGVDLVDEPVREVVDQLGHRGAVDVLQERPVVAGGELREDQLLAGEVDEDEGRDQPEPADQPATGLGQPWLADALAGLLGGPARQPLEDDPGEHHARAAHRGDAGPAHALGPLAGRRRGAVEHDRRQHDQDAGHRRGADVLDLQGCVDVLAEPGAVDQRGDGGHRERRHHALVDADHDGASWPSAAGPGAASAARQAQRPRCLDGGRPAHPGCRAR